MKYKRMRTRVSKYISETDKKRGRHHGVRFKAIIVRLTIFTIAGLYIIKNTSLPLYALGLLPENTAHELSLLAAGIKGYMETAGDKIAVFSNGYLRENNKLRVNACADKEIKIPPGLLDILSAKSDGGKEFAPILPCRGEISSPYGERVHPIEGSESFHNGIDIAAVEGEEVAACFDGEVIKAEFSPLNGKHVKIKHTGGYISSYSHMSELRCSVGDIVKTGDKIGSVGSTGAATGPHLHFEILHYEAPINPMDCISGDIN